MQSLGLTKVYLGLPGLLASIRLDWAEFNFLRVGRSLAVCYRLLLFEYYLNLVIAFWRSFLWAQSTISKSNESMAPARQ